MMERLSSLPLEIILVILSHLPFKSLLAYGETSRKNYEQHIASLRHLRIAVFQKRIHSLVSFLQAGWAMPDQVGPSGDIDNEVEFPYTITVIQPQLHSNTKYTPPNTQYYPEKCRTSAPLCHPPSILLRRMIQTQNEIFACFVNRYGRSLLDLEFMAYDLDSIGAQSLGRHCQLSLRHLALRFEHPHVRDGFTKPSTWLKPAPGSTAWNSLIGIGPSKKHRDMKVTGLETLVMERAGITPWQLMMLVRNNPNLTTLKLRTCSGVQPEFLDWLGGIRDSGERGPEYDSEQAPGSRLKVLWLENSQRLLDRTVEHFDKLPGETCDFGLEWVRGLTSLKFLSFNGCTCVSPIHVRRANETIWGIPKVILPYSLPTNDTILEVDPMNS